MNFFEDKPPDSPEENLQAERLTVTSAELAAAEPSVPQLAGDPLSYLPVTPAGLVPQPNLPEDLRISWSWPHLLVFGVFVVSSLLTLQLVVILYFSADKHLSQNQ